MRQKPHYAAVFGLGGAVLRLPEEEVVLALLRQNIAGLISACQRLMPRGRCVLMSLQIPRSTYASLYGPTTGDRVRLADTDLLIEVEHDYTVYGDEIPFGGGKVIRDGMG